MADNFSTRYAKALLKHDIDLMRVDAGTRRQILGVLKGLEKDAMTKLAKFGTMSGAIATPTIKQAELIAQSIAPTIKKAYTQMTDLLGDTMVKVGGHQSDIVLTELNRAVTVDLGLKKLDLNVLKTLPGKTMIEGAPIAQWFNKQSEDLQTKFLNQMRMGIVNGESIPEIARRVRGTAANGFKDGIMQASRSQAQTLTRSAVMASANKARLATYAQNAAVIKGMQWLSTLDSRTSDICKGLDQESWYLGGDPIPPTKTPFLGPPPAHFNCRSTLVPVTKSWSELTKNPKIKKKLDALPPSKRRGLRASMDGLVSDKLDYEDWLSMQDPGFQLDVLKPVKFRMWKAGQIDFRDLVDQSHNPLTIDELIAKFGSPKISLEEALKRAAETQNVAGVEFASPTQWYKAFADTSVTPEQIVDSFDDVTQAKLWDTADKLKAQKTTSSIYMKNGEWDPKRVAEVHDDIVDAFINEATIKAATPAAGEQPRFVMLGGRGASGKGSLTTPKSKGGLGVLDENKFIVLDNDKIKAMLPGYDGWNAFLYHDEAGFILNRIDATARKHGLNVVWDGTLRSINTPLSRMAKYEAAGYQTEGYYMFLPPQKAAVRTVQRFKGPKGDYSGRFVPPKVVLSNTANEAVFEELSKKFTKWEFYDNQGAKPKLIGKGGIPEELQIKKLQAQVEEYKVAVSDGVKPNKAAQAAYDSLSAPEKAAITTEVQAAVEAKIAAEKALEEAKAQYIKAMLDRVPPPPSASKIINSLSDEAYGALQEQIATLKRAAIATAKEEQVLAQQIAEAKTAYKQAALANKAVDDDTLATLLKAPPDEVAAVMKEAEELKKIAAEAAQEIKAAKAEYKAALIEGKGVSNAVEDIIAGLPEAEFSALEAEINAAKSALVTKKAAQADYIVTSVTGDLMDEKTISVFKSLSADEVAIWNKQAEAAQHVQDMMIKADLQLKMKAINALKKEMGVLPSDLLPEGMLKKLVTSADDLKTQAKANYLDNIINGAPLQQNTKDVVKLMQLDDLEKWANEASAALNANKAAAADKAAQRKLDKYAAQKATIEKKALTSAKAKYGQDIASDLVAWDDLAASEKLALVDKEVEIAKAKKKITDGLVNYKKAVIAGKTPPPSAVKAFDSLDAAGQEKVLQQIAEKKGVPFKAAAPVADDEKVVQLQQLVNQWADEWITDSAAAVKASEILGEDLLKLEPWELADKIDDAIVKLKASALKGKPLPTPEYVDEVVSGDINLSSEKMVEMAAQIKGVPPNTLTTDAAFDILDDYAATAAKVAAKEAINEVAGEAEHVLEQLIQSDNIGALNKAKYFLNKPVKPISSYATPEALAADIKAVKGELAQVIQDGQVFKASKKVAQEFLTEYNNIASDVSPDHLLKLVAHQFDITDPKAIAFNDALEWLEAFASGYTKTAKTLGEKIVNGADALGALKTPLKPPAPARAVAVKMTPAKADDLYVKWLQDAVTDDELMSTVSKFLKVPVEQLTPKLASKYVQAVAVEDATSLKKALDAIKANPVAKAQAPKLPTPAEADKLYKTWLSTDMNGDQLIAEVAKLTDYSAGQLTEASAAKLLQTLGSGDKNGLAKAIEAIEKTAPNAAKKAPPRVPIMEATVEQYQNKAAALAADIDSGALQGYDVIKAAEKFFGTEGGVSKAAYDDMPQNIKDSLKIGLQSALKNASTTPSKAKSALESAQKVHLKSKIEVLQEAPKTEPPPKVVTEKAPGPNMDKLTKVGQQGGSNPGGTYQDTETGVKWYVKTPASEDIARNEVLAGKLYEKLGIEVPEMYNVTLNGKPSIASKIIDGLSSDSAALRAGKVANAAEGFVADAWLGNWDVVGMDFDNLLVKAGRAIRVDTGGALRYRAQGGLKGNAFGKTVDELDSMRNAGTNRQTASVFAGVTDAQMKAAAKKIVALTRDEIAEIVVKYGPKEKAVQDELIDILVARQQDLKKRFKIRATRAKPAAVKTQAKLSDKDFIADSELKEIQNARANGYARKSDGLNIEDQQILFWEEASPQATGFAPDRTGAFFKVRNDAYKAMNERMQPFRPTGAMRAAEENLPPKLKDAINETQTLHNAVIKAVKGIATNSETRAVDLERVAAVRDSWKAARDAIETAIRSGDIDAGDLAKFDAKYDPILKALSKATANGEGGAQTWGWSGGNIEAMAVKRVEKKVVEEVKKEAPTITWKWTKGAYNAKEVSKGFMKDTGQRLHFRRAGETWAHYFEAELPNGVRIRYWDDTAPKAQQGTVEMIAPKAGQEGKNLIQQALDQLEIDYTRPSVADDEERYLRQLLSSVGKNPDRVTRAADQGSRIERLAKAASEEYGVEDIRKLPNYRPAGTERSFGQGFRYYERPDLYAPDDLKWMDENVFVHSSDDPTAFFKALIEDGGNFGGKQDVLRRGKDFTAHGMSPDADMNNGGGTYAYFKARQKGASNGTGFYFDGRLVRRTDLRAHYDDPYGRIEEHQRTLFKSGELNSSGLNSRSFYEVIFKNGVSLYDYNFQLRLGSQSQVDDLIAWTKKQGGDFAKGLWPDGRKLEDVIILGSRY